MVAATSRRPGNLFRRCAPCLLLFAGTALAPIPAAPAGSWRLRYIDLDITIDPTAQRLSGVSRLRFSPVGPVTDLIVDLADSLTLDSARVVYPATARPAGVREAGAVRFAVDGKPAGPVVVALWYNGHPIRRAVGFAPGGRRAASYGLPRSAREWWPSADDPSQKADSADLRFTAPAALTVASNGRLVGRVPSPDGRTATAHWSVRHPIYSDVVSFALGDYAVLRDSVLLTGGRRIPLEFYLFPEDSAKGAVDFSPVGEVLQFYQSRLGPYPFADEKYALVEFGRPSFREGQTLSHLGTPLITGNRQNEQVVAHEIAHQWFGNSLSVRSWQDIWLNESLSEFMAWQWIRHAQGDSAYQALIDQALATSFPQPIAPASLDDFGTLFGAGTFLKGPVVLEMLQEMMGESAFGRALGSYVAGHTGGSVESADFQRACERAYHQPLGWFFDQWVRGTSIPALSLSWEPTGQRGATVRVRQTQSGAPLRLRLVLRASSASGQVQRTTVWLEKAAAEYAVRTDAPVSAVTLDPASTLLRMR